ncbi:hypothetical protein [Corynebacterium glutamicum]|uniref:hypothetical protein n=1 Tax=Corynebacterium glutamicum TaxID=1718 RepID=UPI0005C5FC91|nr:hypothetical protein [Corynebacterium glutamicum]
MTAPTKMPLADSPMGQVPAYLPHKVRPRQCEALTESGCTLEVRPPVQGVGGRMRPSSTTYYIHRSVFGGYIVNGEGIDAQWFSSVVKARRIIDLMAQEYEYQRCDA